MPPLHEFRNYIYWLRFNDSVAYSLTQSRTTKIMCQRKILVFGYDSIYYKFSIYFVYDSNISGIKPTIITVLSYLQELSPRKVYSIYLFAFSQTWMKTKGFKTGVLLFEPLSRSTGNSSLAKHLSKSSMFCIYHDITVSDHALTQDSQASNKALKRPADEKNIVQASCVNKMANSSEDND